jgi:hypothetical protein
MPAWNALQGIFNKRILSGLKRLRCCRPDRILNALRRGLSSFGRVKKAHAHWLMLSLMQLGNELPL